MPRDNRLFTLLLTIAVCLHTVQIHICMLWLTMIMQKPAIARRTVAIELLRRLDQMEGNKRRSQSAPARPRFGGYTPGHGISRHAQHKPRGRLQITATALSLSRQTTQNAREEATTDALATQPSLLTSYGAHASQLAIHDASELSLDQKLDCKDPATSTVTQGFYATSNVERERDVGKLNQQIAESAQELTHAIVAELTPPASPAKRIGPTDAHSDGYECIITPQRRGSWRLIADRGRTVSMSNSGLSAGATNGFYSSSPPSSQPFASLGNDTVEGAAEDSDDSADRTLVMFNTTEEASSMMGELCHSKFQQNASNAIDTSTKNKRSSVVLRARDKTNGGLLEFMASPTKLQRPALSRKHRRGVPLNLPVRPILPHPGDNQLGLAQPSFANAPISRVIPEETVTTIEVEQELQYKHRHIFVGTASLHNFLEVVETTQDSITKYAVMKAFTILAAKEQLIYRQASSTTEDWNLVTRITPDIASFDCLIMSRLVLGSISLQQFVDSIPFDACDKAPIVVVVEAFKNASHMEAAEDRIAGSKARAFEKAPSLQMDAIE